MACQSLCCTWANRTIFVCYQAPAEKTLPRRRAKYVRHPFSAPPVAARMWPKSCAQATAPAPCIQEGGNTFDQGCGESKGYGQVAQIKYRMTPSHLRNNPAFQSKIWRWGFIWCLREHNGELISTGCSYWKHSWRCGSLQWDRTVHGTAPQQSWKGGTTAQSQHVMNAFNKIEEVGAKSIL